MKKIGNTDRLREHTVNGNKENILTVNSKSTSKKILGLIEDVGYSEDDIANSLAEGLNDHKSLRYFQLLVENNPPEKLLEALSCVKNAEREGTVRYKPAYYLAILRNWGMKVKFKRSEYEQ